MIPGEIKYFIEQNGKAIGPFTIDELRYRSVTPSTLIWYEGLPEWVPAESIEIIRREILSGSTTPNSSTGFSQNPYMQGNTFPPVCPSTYLIPAILLSICCCNPIAIVAIVYALQVEPAYSKGFYDRAVDASMSARRWCIIAGVAWVIIFILSNIRLVSDIFTYMPTPFSGLF